jgi:hypothetical protein
VFGFCTIDGTKKMPQFSGFIVSGLEKYGLGGTVRLRYIGCPFILTLPKNRVNFKEI